MSPAKRNGTKPLPARANMAWQGGPRCVKCRRVVTYAFRQLGLGTVTSELVTLAPGDGYMRTHAEHTYPCVGHPLRPLKALIATWLPILNANAARLPLSETKT